jgi:serine protease Do
MDNTAAKTRASYRSAVLVCVVAIAAAAGLSAARFVPQEWRAPTHSAPLQSAGLFSRGTSAPASFADVVDAVKSAVVGVKTKRSETSNDQLSSGSPADRFSNQFGAPPLTPETPGGRHPPRTVTTQGSGFFISADGYAVTNNHVVEGAKRQRSRPTIKRPTPPRWSAAIPSATLPCSRSTAAAISPL